MFSKKQILSMVAGVAMLALPVSAFAGHHGDDDDWDARPFAQHDRGLHRGWFKHHEFRGGSYGRPYGFHRECDEDGDDCEYERNAPPNYRYNQGYGFNQGYEDEDEDEGGAYPYPSYFQGSQAGYGRSQSLSWLLAKRRQTMFTIAQLRARHDSRGAARLVPVVKSLNQQISARSNGRGYNGGYNYAPPTYLGPTSYGASNAYPYNGAPYGYGLPYNGAYNGAGYTGNPTVDALSAIAVPLLSGGIR